MIGFLIGIVFGGLQFWILRKFTVRVTSSGVDIKCMLLGMLQLIIPLVALLGVALLRRQDILWTGVGITSFLLIGALAIFIKNRKPKGRGNNDA